ncbi:hypothetical protein AVEN_213346-1 [Araneus ventricosus]|uniref:DDE-1 domain-containing protein n=1 Tax=Araneus ventricosus TaxID=182803 RepID=A0A4Y2JA09_ARAVE|nr:hypothetical protein AVEN_213346-1 [Araneus ventricosus]
MDQCPAHPQDLPTFNNTKVVFFPENCTSKIQPLDPSVTRCVKVHYRKTLIRQHLAASKTKHETKDELKQVTVLDAIHMFCSSWRNITEKCIKSCFKAFLGFSFPAENEYEEPENESENDINEEDCHTVSRGLAMRTFNKFVDADEKLITAQLREIKDTAAEINGGEEDEDNDDEDASKVPPTHTVALETLRDYFQFNFESEGNFSRLDELEKTLFENSRKQKQSSIVNYFVRE